MSDATGSRSTASSMDGLTRNQRQSPPIGLSDTLGPVARALASRLIGTGRRQLAIADVQTAISRFLRVRTAAPIVPSRERSLELFDDEKRLEQLARTDWFGPDRLRLEQLRCEPVAPPFAWQPLGDADNRDDGSVLLAVENHTTYHT